MATWIITVGIATSGLPVDEMESSSSPHPHGWRAVIWPVSYATFFVMVPLILAGALAVLVEIGLDMLPEVGVSVGVVEQTLAETIDVFATAIRTDLSQADLAGQLLVAPCSASVWVLPLAIGREGPG